MNCKTAPWTSHWTTKLTMGALSLLCFNLNGAIAQNSIAQNPNRIFRSATGNTIFPASAQQSCAGQVVEYTTHYRGIAYQGYLWVESPTPAGGGCDGGRGRTLQGYFEERGSGNQWCRGRLTVYLTHGPQGGSYAQWQEINAVPGYACAGAGKTPSLSLHYQR